MDSPGASARIAAPKDAPEDVLEAALEAVIEDMGRVAIAVSGGVDSMTLAARAVGGPARRITNG